MLASETICQTDVPGEGTGCGTTFPKKTQPGLCSRCLYLNTSNDVKEYARVANLPVCIGCGIPCTQQLCEKCKLAYVMELSGQENADQSNEQSLSVWNQPQGTITVCMAVRIGKWISARHGFSVGVYPKDKLLIEIQQLEVDRLNQSSWCVDHAEPLMREDTYLRWHQNILLGCHDEGAIDTLGKLYQLYHNHLLATPLYANLPQAFQNVNGKYVVLELFIDNDSYKRRIERIDLGYIDELEQQEYDSE